MDEVLAEDLDELRRTIKRHEAEINKLVEILQGVIDVLRTVAPNAKIS